MVFNFCFERVYRYRLFLTLLDGQDGDGPSSMDIRPSSKRSNQSKVTQRLSETSPKANLIDSKVAVAFLPILKQHFVHGRRSVILSIVKSRLYTKRLICIVND